MMLWMLRPYKELKEVLDKYDAHDMQCKQVQDFKEHEREYVALVREALQNLVNNYTEKVHGGEPWMEDAQKRFNELYETSTEWEKLMIDALVDDMFFCASGGMFAYYDTEMLNDPERYRGKNEDESNEVYYINTRRRECGRLWKNTGEYGGFKIRDRVFDVMDDRDVQVYILSKYPLEYPLYTILKKCAQSLPTEGRSYLSAQMSQEPVYESNPYRNTKFACIFSPRFYSYIEHYIP